MLNTLSILLFYLLKNCSADNLPDVMFTCDESIWFVTFGPLHFGYSVVSLPLAGCDGARSSLGHQPKTHTLFDKHLASQQLHARKISVPVSVSEVTLLAALLQGWQEFLTASRLQDTLGSPARVLQGGILSAEGLKLWPHRNPIAEELLEMKLPRLQTRCLGPGSPCFNKPFRGSQGLLPSRTSSNQKAQHVHTPKVSVNSCVTGSPTPFLSMGWSDCRRK